MRAFEADWWSLCAAQWKAAARLGESVVAANIVIGTRLELMRQACCDPASGDYVELTRMVSEKVKAVTQASASLARDAQVIQAEAIAAAFGGPADPVRMIGRAMEAPGRAFAPAHAKMVSNARRLSRRKAR